MNCHFHNWQIMVHLSLLMIIVSRRFYHISKSLLSLLLQSDMFFLQKIHFSSKFQIYFFQICLSFDIEFLPFHFWVGVWLAIIATLVVAFEGSCLLRYVSRFTQDIFALLISLIFIFESLKKLYIVSKL